MKQSVFLSNRQLRLSRMLQSEGIDMEFPPQTTALLVSFFPTDSQHVPWDDAS